VFTPGYIPFGGADQDDGAIQAWSPSPLPCGEDGGVGEEHPGGPIQADIPVGVNREEGGWQRSKSQHGQRVGQPHHDLS
jgi:hypothetical protein